MGKKMTKAGAELRRAVRADLDADPNIDHKKIRSKHGVAEGIIESAMTKTLAEWDALIATTPDDEPAATKEKTFQALSTSTNGTPASSAAAPTPAANAAAMPGLEQGIVKFTRKPAKMGQDYIFWIPRVYIKNGLVDQACEYEVYLKRKV